MKRILITGGAGFVGSNLAVNFRLHYPSKEVMVLDNLHRRGSELSLPRLLEYGISFFHGDTRNPEDLKALPAFDLLIECSAEPSVLAGQSEAPSYCINTNLVGTTHCLDAALQNNAPIIFLSTSRVYPYQSISEIPLEESETRFELPADLNLRGISVAGIAETFPLEGPKSIYGATKLCSELLIEEFVHAYGLRAIVNRCGAIAGPWQYGRIDQGVFAYWMLAHMFDWPLRYIGYNGTGKQVRDVIHVEDFFHLIDRQLKYLDYIRFDTFNVGGGLSSNLSLRELTSICRRACDRRIDIAKDPETRPADIPIYISDTSKAQKAFDWTPNHSPEKILDDIHQWILSDPDTIRRGLG